MIKVSVLTPVYNGEKFIRHCIESVLRQTHSNWEYIIVNNCSSDHTLDIVKTYVARDSRIQVHSNKRFVNADENHNIAFQCVAADSKYVKVVSADDWITDDCIEKLVALAERHCSVGIVGCYQQRNESLLWKGLPTDVSVIKGKDMARRALLDGLHVLGAPTSVLYRADLVRSKTPFYPHTRPHADTDACYEILADHDLGFVHEVLAYDRVHPEQESRVVKSFHAYLLAYIEAVIKYGKIFLTPQEQAKRLHELEDRYYDVLGRALLKMRGPKFWRFQVEESGLIGFRFRIGRVLSSATRMAIHGLLSPGTSMRKCYKYFRGRMIHSS